MKQDKNVLKSLAMISQFAINILVPVFLCSFAGYWLDEKLGTSFLFIVFFFIGALAGGRNVFILARKIYDDKDTSPSRLYASNRKKKK